MKEAIKRTVCAAIVIIGFACGYSQTPSERPWKATVKVVDESGQPIQGAAVTIGYYVPPREGQTIATSSTKGRTDANGLFSASGETRSVDLFFGADKEGYYHSHLDYELGAPYQYDPVKWSPNMTLLLKKVIRPVPMYAKMLAQEPPVLNEAVGFDLMVGDWVAPHGKGHVKDFVFTKNLSFQSNVDYEGKVTLAFSSPGDGIQVFQPSDLEKTSSLKSPHEAPPEGYGSKLMRETSAHPGQSGKFEFDPNRIYLFRVRTVLDEHGNVKSALYGKIYGDFMQFRYYLNPAANDRNIEFDPKRNLLKGLRGSQIVDAP